jgi:hypothetical protein
MLNLKNILYLGLAMVFHFALHWLGKQNNLSQAPNTKTLKKNSCLSVSPFSEPGVSNAIPWIESNKQKKELNGGRPARYGRVKNQVQI